MKFWFVSRERFEDERARCLKLEAELERLREMLIPGLRAPVPPQAQNVEPLILREGDDYERITPISGRPTIGLITGEANRAAAARKPGDKGIAQELIDSFRKPVVLVSPAVSAADHPKAVNGD